MGNKTTKIEVVKAELRTAFGSCGLERCASSCCVGAKGETIEIEHDIVINFNQRHGGRVRMVQELQWYQFGTSGFYFRIEKGRCVEGVCMIFVGDVQTWTRFNPIAGQTYYETKKELFTPVSFDVDFLYSTDATYEFALEIIAE